MLCTTNTYICLIFFYYKNRWLGNPEKNMDPCFIPPNMKWKSKVNDIKKLIKIYVWLNIKFNKYFTLDI